MAIDFARSGRLLSASKSQYRMRFPEHAVYFNANLFAADKRKIWWGDIDLTLDRPELQRYARELNEEIFLLAERDGRFLNEDNPDLELAVARFPPSY